MLEMALANWFTNEDYPPDGVDWAWNGEVSFPDQMSHPGV